MRLTNSIRSAFVRSVMADVPQVKYDEEYRKECKAVALSLAPEKLRPFLQDLKYENYFRTSYVHASPGLSAHVRDCDRLDSVYNNSPKLAEIIAKATAQNETQTRLRQSINAAANSANTVKQLKNMFPEFAKYLPADEAAADRSVPCVQNVVADFVKAGWPKGKPVEIDPPVCLAKRIRTSKRMPKKVD
jgi:hypothetical protein